MERVRLAHRTERVAKTTGLGVLGGFLFGSVFVIVGILIVLVGLKVVPVDPATVHAPNWVLALIGVIFAVSGLLVWSMVLQERLLVIRRQIMAARHPRSEVYADYPWDLKGITKSTWEPVGKSLGATMFFAVFLAPFNWWAWLSEAGELMVKVIVSVFDLCLLLSAIELVRRILVAVKYGKSRLEYEMFPILTGLPAEFRWFAPAGLERATRITFVLRCVEEWMESRGTGKQRSTILIHEQLWAAIRKTEGPVDCPSNCLISLSFDVPATAPGSNLSEKLRIIFWELEVCAEAPGVDFQERYLVPIYPGKL